MDELDSIIQNARPIDANSALTGFIRASVEACVNTAKQKPGHNLGALLASVFDLCVLGEYARNVGNNGWLFCRHDAQGNTKPVLLYPFVNACPRCSSRNKFAFAACKKPESAVIGRTTSAILAAIFNEIVKKNSGGACGIHLLNGNGVVDAVIREGSDICLMEIKSSPLVTFPLILDTEDLTETDTDGTERVKDHIHVTVSKLRKTELYIYLPRAEERMSLGIRDKNKDWPYGVLANIVTDAKVFARYYAAWKDVYDRYSDDAPHEGSYWLANGCGQPVPRPSAWPQRRVGGGYESISDGKSSVGMDRTDDIKKGIYQVLKIGTHYKEFRKSETFNVRTALFSNMHAVRHHKEYLKEFSDLIWSIDDEERSYKIEKLKEEWRIPIKGVHNLYDALVSLTKSHIRDSWLSSRLSLTL